MVGLRVLCSPAFELYVITEYLLPACDPLETNFVQSLYDLLISEVRLDLAVGDPIPGEAVEESVGE